MQPNDERDDTGAAVVVVANNASQNKSWSGYSVRPSARLDVSLSNHINAVSGWGGYPSFVANTPGKDVVGSTNYVLVPSVIGLATASAQDALKDAGLGTITVASAVTPAVSNVALTSNVATITTSAAHGYAVGDSVVIAGLTTTALNGTYTIASVPSTVTFTFAKTTSNIPSASDSGTAKVAAKAGKIKTQSVAAGQSSVAPGTAITITPYFAS